MATCPEHSGHSVRLNAIEEEIAALKEEDARMKEKIGSPAIWVALISFVGVCVTATTSFLAVVLAPMIRAYLGVQ